MNKLHDGKFILNLNTDALKTTIIFDWGGVFEYHNRVNFFNEILGTNQNVSDDVIQHYTFCLQKLDSGEMMGKDFFLEFKQRYNLTINCEEFFQIFFRAKTFNIPLLRLLRQIRENYLTILLTDNFEENLAYYEKLFSISKLFHYIFVSCRLGITKPRSFSTLQELLNINPNNCIIIDDNLKHLETAMKLGFQTIGYSDLPQLKIELQTSGVVLPD